MYLKPRVNFIVLIWTGMHSACYPIGKTDRKKNKEYIYIYTDTHAYIKEVFTYGYLPLYFHDGLSLGFLNCSRKC